MRIAVLGAGRVGMSLGLAWANAENVVRFGVPEPRVASRKHEAKPSTSKVSFHPVSIAVTEADVVVLATPWPAVAEALTQAGDLAGKVLIDATNPLLADFSWMEDDYAISGAERVAALAPGAHVFKAFNQTGSENMADPSAFSKRPVMFACGDDAPSVDTVINLIEQTGFEGVYAGPLKVARLIEPYAMLWIHLSKQLGRDFAFCLEKGAEK